VNVVANAANVILATEFIDNASIINDSGAYNAQGVSASYRPVHGFVSKVVPIPTGPWKVTGRAAAPPNANGGQQWLDVFSFTTLPDLSNDMRPCVAGDVCPDPTANFQVNNWAPSNTTSRLDWVGRNHGRGKYSQKTTNFLYVDGHVETRTIEDTLTPFQWGDRFYSIQ
jgi:prepilin-type processing-associated H-X9-DG protein